ncbi:MAG TPA: hypothetical protein VFS40_12595 [Gemmatimonadales bacterium]|nr:hypothetical protein [Gemmatimonadales bacterium]
MSGTRRGFLLLEVLVALMILATAGLLLVRVVVAAQRSTDTLGSTEREAREAARVLTAMTLLTRTDLDRRLGRHPVRDFVVTVQRPEPALYRIGVAAAAAPERELLVTVVWRPGPAAVAP